MSTVEKTAQIQVRVSPEQKEAIRRAAKRVGMDLSAYVLDRALSAAAERFQECLKACAGLGQQSFALAELNTLLSGLDAGELRRAVAAGPTRVMSPFAANYVAAMVEYACARRGIDPPSWAMEIEPLEDPVFGSSLEGLRLHLLTHSPPPFRRRNIFIDASLGRQV